MKKLLINAVRAMVRPFGADVVPYFGEIPPDITDENAKTCAAVKDFTMTTVERVNALVDAVNYVVANDIQGAMVECGVWKGGSSMAMAMALSAKNQRDRDIYLYDTYAGMPAPAGDDVSFLGVAAEAKFARTRTGEDSSDWCRSALDEVKANLRSTGYPAEKLHFVKGKVEDTIPGTVPESIALLRLDTDWYESTKHEMIHLFPRLQPGGILIIDDYGHWRGSRKAVDEYLLESQQHLLLSRVDYSCRVAIKTPALK